MVEDYTFRVAVTAIFAAVNGSVMPFVDRMNGFAIRAHPDVRMSASVFLDLGNLKSPCRYVSFYLECHSTSLRYVLELMGSGSRDAIHGILFTVGDQWLILLNSGQLSDVLS